MLLKIIMTFNYHYKTQMRFILALLLFLIICFSGFIKIPKNNFSPPGTILIIDSLFMDKIEISNEIWKEFIQSNMDEMLIGSDEYIRLIPDSTISIKLKNYGKIKMKEYFNDPRFDEYPVVGITYEQVLKFCEWRTKKVNELIKQRKNNPLIKLEYRLPTIHEWEIAAQGNLDSIKYPFGIDIYYTLDVNKYRSINCYYPEMTSLNYIRKTNDTLQNIKSNSYGLYNMLGNVCEMVFEKGLAKGGHYDALLENCKIKETYTYSSANKWLGFRCICLVTKQITSNKSKKNQK